MTTEVTNDDKGSGVVSTELHLSQPLAEPPTLRRTLFTDEATLKTSRDGSETAAVSGVAADRTANAAQGLNAGTGDREEHTVATSETPKQSRAVSPRKSPFPDTTTAWRKNDDTCTSPKHASREPSPHAANQARVISPRMSAALAVSTSDKDGGGSMREGGEQQQLHSPPASPAPVVDLAAVSNASRERRAAAAAAAPSAALSTESSAATVADTVGGETGAAELPEGGREPIEALKDKSDSSSHQPPPPPSPVVLTRRSRGSSPKANSSTTDASNAQNAHNPSTVTGTSFSANATTTNASGSAATSAATAASSSLSEARSALVAASDEKAAAASADFRPKRVGSPHRPAPSSLKPGSPRASSPKASSSSGSSGFTGSGSPKASRHRSSAPSPARALVPGGLAAAARAGTLAVAAPHMTSEDSAVEAAGAVSGSSHEERPGSPRGQASKSWRSQSNRPDRHLADKDQGNEDGETSDKSAPRGGSPFLRLAAARRSRSLTQSNGNSGSPQASSASSPGPPSPRGPIAAAGSFGPHRGRSPTSSSTSSSIGSKGLNSPARSSSSSSKTPSPLSLSGGGGVGFPRQSQSSRRRQRPRNSTDAPTSHVAWASDQDPQLLADWRVVLGCSSQQSISASSSTSAGSSTTKAATSGTIAAAEIDGASNTAAATITATNVADLLALEAAELATSLELSVNDHGLNVLKALQRTNPNPTNFIDNRNSSSGSSNNMSSLAGVALPSAVYERLLAMYEERAVKRYLAKKKVRSRASSPLHASSNQGAKPTAPSAAAAAAASPLSSPIPVVDLPDGVSSTSAAVDINASTTAGDASIALAPLNGESIGDNNTNGAWNEASVREAGRAYALKLALCFVKHGVYEVDRPKRPLPSTFSKRARRRPSPPPPPPKHPLPGDQKKDADGSSIAKELEAETVTNSDESLAENKESLNEDCEEIEDCPDVGDQNDNNVEVDDSNDAVNGNNSIVGDNIIGDSAIGDDHTTSDNRQITVAEAHSVPLSPSGTLFGAPFASLKPARPGSPRATGPPSRSGRGAGPGPVYFGGSGGRAGSRPPRVRSEAEQQERALAKQQWQLAYGGASAACSTSDVDVRITGGVGGADETNAVADSDNASQNHNENGKGRSAAATALAAAVAEFFSSYPTTVVGRTTAPVTVVGGVLRFKQSSIRDFLVAKHLAEECAAAVHRGQEQSVGKNDDEMQNNDLIIGATARSASAGVLADANDLAASLAVVAGHAMAGAWGTLELDRADTAGVRGFLIDFLLAPPPLIHNTGSTNGFTANTSTTDNRSASSISGVATPASTTVEATPSGAVSVATSESSPLQRCLLDHLVVLTAAVAANAPSLPSSVSILSLSLGRTNSDSNSSGINSLASHNGGHSTIDSGSSGNSASDSTEYCSSSGNSSQGSNSSGNGSNSSSGSGNEVSSTRKDDSNNSGSSDDSNCDAWVRCRRSLAAVALAPMASDRLRRSSCLLHAAVGESLILSPIHPLEAALSLLAVVMSAGMAYEDAETSGVQLSKLPLETGALSPGATRLRAVESFWTTCHAAWQREQQRPQNQEQCNDTSTATEKATNTSKVFPLDCRRQDGASPLDVALAERHSDAAALLRRCGATCSVSNTNIGVDMCANSNIDNGSNGSGSGAITAQTSVLSSSSGKSSSNSVSLLEALEAKSFGGREWREPKSPTTPQQQQQHSIPPPPPARNTPRRISDKSELEEQNDDEHESDSDEDDDNDDDDDSHDDDGDEDVNNRENGSKHGDKDIEAVGGLLQGLDEELAGFLTSIDTEEQPMEETAPSEVAGTFDNDCDDEHTNNTSSSSNVDNSDRCSSSGKGNEESSLPSNDNMTNEQVQLDPALLPTPLKPSPDTDRASSLPLPQSGILETPSRQLIASTSESSPPQQLSPGGEEADALAREMSDLLWSQAEADTQRAAAKAAADHSRQTTAPAVTATNLDLAPAPAPTALALESVDEAAAASNTSHNSTAVAVSPTEEVAASVWAAERAGLEARVNALEQALQSVLLAAKKNSSQIVASGNEATTSASIAVEAAKMVEKEKEHEDKLAVLTQRVECAESDAAAACADAAAARATATKDADVAKRAVDDVRALKVKLAESDALLEAARAEAARSAEEAALARREASKHAEALAKVMRQSKFEVTHSHVTEQQPQPKLQHTPSALDEVSVSRNAASASAEPTSNSEVAAADQSAVKTPDTIKPVLNGGTTAEPNAKDVASSSSSFSSSSSAPAPTSRSGAKSEANANTLEILRAASRGKSMASSNTNSPSRSVQRRSSPTCSSVKSRIDHRSSPDRHSSARGGVKPPATSVFQESLRRFETASSTRAPPAPTRSSTPGGSAGSTSSSTSSSPARSSSRSSSRSRFLPSAMAPPDTAPPTALSASNSAATATTTGNGSASNIHTTTTTTTTPVRTRVGMAPPASPPPEAVRSGRGSAALPPPATPPTKDEKFSSDTRSRAGGRENATSGSSSGNSADAEHRRRSSNSPRRRTPTPDSAWIGRGARGVTDPTEDGADGGSTTDSSTAAMAAASTSPRRAGGASLVGVGGSGPVLLRSAGSSSAAAAGSAATGGGAPPLSPRSSSSSGAVARAAARLQRAAEQPASISPPQSLSSASLEVPRPPPRRSGANGSTANSPNPDSTANSHSPSSPEANETRHSTTTTSSHESARHDKAAAPSSKTGGLVAKQAAPSLTDFVAALPAERVRTPTRQQSYNARSPGH